MTTIYKTVGKRLLVEPLENEKPEQNTLVGGNDIASYKVIATSEEVEELGISVGTEVILNKKNIIKFRCKNTYFQLVNLENILMYNEEIKE